MKSLIVALCSALAIALLAAGCQGGLTLDSAVGSVGNIVTRAATTGRSAFVDMDEPQEIELGRAVTASVGARYQVLRDPALTRYVALVGNAVAAQSTRPDLRYYFAVLDSPEVNAFATPGGFVFVTRGALQLMRDEATLGGVLGHEVAHVALRHGVESVKAQSRKELLMLGLQEGLSHTQVGAFAGAISTAADAVAEQVVLKGFSRKEETEADQAGFQYALRAGYDPAGLRDFLAALVARGGTDSSLKTFFSTHPATQERLQEQERLLKDAPTGGRRNLERWSQAVAAR
jgi:predicted Zn-dependent protease